MTAIQIMTAGKIDNESNSFEVFNEAGEVVATVNACDMFRSKLWQVYKSSEKGGHAEMFSVPRKTPKGGVVENLKRYVQYSLDVLEAMQKAVEDIATAYKALEGAGIHSGTAIGVLNTELAKLKKEARERIENIQPFLKEVGDEFSWTK